MGSVSYKRVTALRASASVFNTCTAARRRVEVFRRSSSAWSLPEGGRLNDSRGSQSSSGGEGGEGGGDVLVLDEPRTRTALVWIGR
ncbi:hypothetical protein HYQ46_007223 [Verticillium longisporum]|nr:hypothetical protein HYQ46_007223 [Verticillium longisporum]